MLWSSFSLGKLYFVVTSVVLVLVVAVSGILYRFQILTPSDLAAEFVVLLIILSYGAVATLLLTLQMVQMKKNIASLMREFELVSRNLQNLQNDAADASKAFRADGQGHAPEKAS